MIRKFGIIGLLPLLFTRCAQILPLSGGEKDITPPKIVHQSPPENTINFTGNSIQIDFDEFIVLKDLRNQLMITPQLNSFPEVLVNGKSLSIKFNEPLLRDRTYTLQFGSSVADLHEGNVYQDLKVVFSTGNYLDSVALTGNIKDAFTGKAAGEVSVFLYAEGEDSCLFRRKPDYFAKANKEGNYQIDRVHPGRYKIFALGDKNKNFLYDQAEEPVDMWYSSTDHLIDLNESTTKNFSVYRELPSRFFVKRILYPHYGKALIIFNRSLHSPKVSVLNLSEDDCKFFFSASGDTLQVFYADKMPDTARMVISQSAKGVEVFSDTVELVKAEKPKEQPGVIHSKWNAKEVHVQTEQENNRITFHFSEYITAVNSSRVIFVADKDTLPCKLKINPGNTLDLQNEEWIGRKGNFIFSPGALINLLKETNDTIVIPYLEEQTLNSAVLTVDLYLMNTSNVILELLHERGQIIRTARFSVTGKERAKHSWKHLPAGNYSMRLIHDADNDGMWTTGTLLSGIIPEQIDYYEKSISLFADWEVNIEWKIE